MGKTTPVTSKRQLNTDALLLWLGAFAGGYTYPRDDDGGGKKGKRGSRVPVNLVWMQACSDPAVRESHEALYEVIVNRMPHEHPLAYLLIEHIYLREDANPAEKEVWRQRVAQANKLKGKKHLTADELKLLATAKLDKKRLKVLSKAWSWILRQAEEMVEDGVIVVPDPIDPVGFVQNSEKAQRVANRVFWSCVERVGEVEARKRAARYSGFSERHIRRLLPPGVSQGVLLCEEAS